MWFKLTRGVVSAGSRIAYGVVGRVIKLVGYLSSPTESIRASTERIASVAITLGGMSSR